MATPNDDHADAVRMPWPKRVASIVGMLILGVFVVALVVQAWRTTLTVIAILVAIILVTTLDRGFAQRLSGIAAAIVWYLVVGPVVTVVLVSGYVAAESASRSHNAILRYAVLGALTIVLGAVIRPILTSNRRTRFAERLDDVGWFALPLFAGFLFFLSAGISAPSPSS